MTTPASQRVSLKGLAVRERLLQACEQLLAERGYDGTTVQLVSAAAAVSRNQFFHHFGSKEALCLAVLERLRRGFRNEISGPAAGFPTPTARLDYALKRLGELEAGDGLRLKLLAALAPVPAILPPVLAEEVEAALIEMLDFWRSLLKDLRKAGGAAGPLKPREGARVVLALLLSSGVELASLQWVIAELSSRETTSVQ